MTIYGLSIEYGLLDIDQIWAVGRRPLINYGRNSPPPVRLKAAAFNSARQRPRSALLYFFTAIACNSKCAPSNKDPAPTNSRAGKSFVVK